MSRTLIIVFATSLIGAVIGNILWAGDPGWSAWSGWLKPIVGF